MSSLYKYKGINRKVRVFWCMFCNKRINKDCGHEYFGDETWEIDLSPGKYYWCCKCDDVINHDCGHFYFGHKNY